MWKLVAKLKLQDVNSKYMSIGAEFDSLYKWHTFNRHEFCSAN